MPTYEYECKKCQRRFEEFQSIMARPLKRIKTDCAQCENNAPVRRLIGTGSAVLFKGSGFYETDYRSESYKKGAKAESDASKDTSKDKKTGDSSGTSSKPKDSSSDGKADKKPKSGSSGP